MNNSNDWCPQSTAALPIRGVSLYVLEKLPTALDSGEICNDELEAVLIQSSDCVNSPLARLDCKMLEAALAHTGQAVPQRLSELVNRLSSYRPKGLLYEEIIEANPSRELRCFTTCESEKLFYRTHQEIEAVLQLILTKLRGDVGVINLDCFHRELEVVITSTASLARMPKRHFDTFRMFLASHPTIGVNGPSGLYSGGMAELQLRSGFVPKCFVDFLSENMVYFPEQSWTQILVARLEYEQNTAQLNRNASVKKILRDFWKRWRDVHLSTVKRQVPNITIGTGGEADPITFLNERMEDDD